MFKLKKKNCYRDNFVDEIPPQVNATLPDRPSVEPALQKILDQHQKHIGQLLKKAPVDVDAADVLGPALEAKIHRLKVHACAKEPERADALACLRGSQRAGLMVNEAYVSQLNMLEESVKSYLAAEEKEEEYGI